MDDKKKYSDELFFKKKNSYEMMDERECAGVNEFCDGYIDFLSAAKTERECVRYAIEVATNNGFVKYDENLSLKPGDKFYKVQRNKAIVLGVIGKSDISSGANIVMAHIDAPRVDLKQNPLYEDSGVALFKTHYYGGIKKYQWTAIPLSLHGVVIKKGGECVEINIGENDGDPVFTITDLLPHLAGDQMTRKATEVVAGESLNILVGSRPFKDDDESQKIKLCVMDILNKKYGITEADFMRADLEAVPAFPAKSVGFDQSLVGAYGQDDRVCAYSALMAVLSVEAPQKTALCVLVDREEIGSMGNTGAQSRFIEYLLADLGDMFGGVPVRKIIQQSACLSADVNLAHDPNYPEVTEKMNTAFINGGVALSKYTGARGKSGTSEASAELVSRICDIFNANGVCYQMGELGKVDQGGGGTVAQFIANLDMEVLDAGVPILSMHSPFEVSAKADVYMAYKAYATFMEKY